MTMFEGLQAIGAAWRTVAHISEWTGLSVGALAGLGALVYFDPKTLKLAVAAAVAVVVAASCLTYGHSVGVADESAKLQTLSDEGDARAATAAKADESARVAEIQQKADKQHADDLATITELKASASPGCAFDPGDSLGGVRTPAAHGAGAVRGNPKAASVTKAADKGTGGTALGRLLHLPLVWGAGVQGQRPPGDAAPHGK